MCSHLSIHIDIRTCITFVHIYICSYLYIAVSKDGGPQYGPQDTTVLIVRTSNR